MNWPSVDWQWLLPIIYLWATAIAFIVAMAAWIYMHANDEAPTVPVVVETVPSLDWEWPTYGPYADIRSDGHLADLLINGGDGVSVEDYVA